jgi:hypothetical protein
MNDGQRYICQKNDFVVGGLIFPSKTPSNVPRRDRGEDLGDHDYVAREEGMCVCVIIFLELMKK